MRMRRCRKDAYRSHKSVLDQNSLALMAATGPVDEYSFTAEAKRKRISASGRNPTIAGQSNFKEESRMKRQQLMRGLIIASFGALAVTAGAQTQQPQGDNPRANSTPGTTAPTSPGGTTSGMGTTNNGTMGSGTSNGMMRDKGSSQMYNDYRTARHACDNVPMAQQESCNNAANKKYSSVDSKCQKLSGSALDDCIRGADHGK
jgi:hypothetical protein